MSPHIDTLSYSNFQRTSAARLLDSTQRQQIALGAINPKTHLKHLAEHHGVSRKFIYQTKRNSPSWNRRGVYCSYNGQLYTLSPSCHQGMDPTIHSRNDCNWPFILPGSGRTTPRFVRL